MSTDLNSIFIDFIIPKDIVKKLLELDEHNMIVINGFRCITDNDKEANEIGLGIARLTVVIDESNIKKLKETITKKIFIIIRTPRGDIVIRQERIENENE